MPRDTRRTSIHTSTGRCIDLANPKATDIDTEDIVHALLRLPRFNGHTTEPGEPWTVLHHSLLVHAIVRDRGHRRQALAALLHDAHEAYVGDISTPVKNIIGEGYAKLVNLLDQVIALRYDIYEGDFYSAPVRAADKEALEVEAYYLLATQGKPEINPKGTSPGTFSDEAFGAFHEIRGYTRNQAAAAFRVRASVARMVLP